jgi:translation initiation factor 1A
LGKKEEEAAQAQEEQLKRIRLPHRNELEMFGIVSQLVGGRQVMVLCEDGKERNCRIPGKMAKRVWMRMNDVVIVKLWDFQPEKADVVWRYMGVQTEHLKKKGYLSKLPV